MTNSMTAGQTAHHDCIEKTRPRILRLVFLFGAATVVLLLAVWGFLGRMVFEKVATQMALPCGIIWYVLSLNVVVAVASRNRQVAVFACLCWLAYTGFGSGFLACAMVRQLEAPFYESRPLEEEPFDVVVVIGGGGSIAGNGRIQGNSSGDRMILAAQLYHAGLTPRFICTGQRINEMFGDGPDPSDVSVDLLVRLGVPETAIERLGGRNTSEEMQTLGEQFRNTNERVGLVTSAWHLPRALRLAKRNGFEPVPLPADFIGGPERSQTIGERLLGFVPYGDNFFHVSRLGKEYLAGLVGR